MSEKNFAHLSLPLITAETAPVDVRGILASVQLEVDCIPHMYAAMANAPGLLEAYLDSTQRFRQESSLTLIEQEVVFLVLSVVNDCPYCVATHSGIAVAVAKAPPEVVEAIRAGKPLSDTKLCALVNFTRAMFNHRGRLSSNELNAFLAAGYRQTNVLDIILAIAITTLSNYTNHAFQTELDDELRPFSWTQEIQHARNGRSS
ncbi:carboxymuconolactone decarboxylase family protein [Cupriavidus sp. IDO]|uniref:carboxymuconolactone decarboxylase family protein n=1 Tax=Cupriavidus sp. IDO TaxID=1539142 RepID=UPI000691E2BE|nr:carboxymuconolactone decarboxylase family protein [Cupriavidus sp. IDO]KWR90891.1 hypothetical protein RM96_07090 [Cupriavidus sp. IDO]